MSNRKLVPNTTDKVDSDYIRVRKQFYDLAEQGDEAIELMLELARESEHPRAFEVINEVTGKYPELPVKTKKAIEEKEKFDILSNDLNIIKKFIKEKAK